MVTQTKPVTIEEFTAYVHQSENADKLFELINGEIVEVSPSRTYYSETVKAANVRGKLRIFLDAGICYWELYPPSKSIDVYAPGKSMQTVDIDGTMDGDDALLVRDIFLE
jgi:hypothetical protein